MDNGASIPWYLKMADDESTIVINKGEPVILQLQWLNDDDTPINLAGATISVPESFPSYIKGAVELEIADAANGLVDLLVPAIVAIDLLPGRSNWFRAKFTNGADSIDVTPLIWIDVQ